MRAKSLLLLTLAIALGGLSVFMANRWLARNAAQSAAPGLETTTVVVARAPLHYGVALDPSKLVEAPWPKGAVPQGAFSSIKALLAEGDRRALGMIEANEPILSSRVTGADGRATLSNTITEGMRAVTIRVNDIYGVAGFVLPGDRVDVMLTRSLEKTESPITDILLQNVKVLAIDQKVDEPKQAAAVVARAVTMEVTPEQAQKLTLGSSVGTLSLALRNLAHTAATAQRRVTTRDLGMGEASSAVSKGTNVGNTVRVVRGATVEEVDVSRELPGPARPGTSPTKARAPEQAVQNGAPESPAKGLPRSPLPDQLSERF